MANGDGTAWTGLRLRAHPVVLAPAGGALLALGGAALFVALRHPTPWWSLAALAVGAAMAVGYPVVRWLVSAVTISTGGIEVRGGLRRRSRVSIPFYRVERVAVRRRVGSWGTLIIDDVGAPAALLLERVPHVRQVERLLQRLLLDLPPR